MVPVFVFSLTVEGHSRQNRPTLERFQIDPGSKKFLKSKKRLRKTLIGRTVSLCCQIKRKTKKERGCALRLLHIAALTLKSDIEAERGKSLDWKIADQLFNIATDVHGIVLKLFETLESAIHTCTE
jgi:hypothetical protein